MCLYYIKKELKRRKNGYEVHKQTLEHVSVYPPHRPLSLDIYLRTIGNCRIQIQLKTDNCIINGRAWDPIIPQCRCNQCSGSVTFFLRIRNLILGSVLIIKNPDPRGPKTYGSYGTDSWSWSGTLAANYKLFFSPKWTGKFHKILHATQKWIWPSARTNLVGAESAEVEGLSHVNNLLSLQINK